MNVTRIPADVLFRVYTACASDTRTLILDVRPLKDFKKQHIMGSYSIRLAATGQTLLDYSKNTYDVSWSQGCWWDNHVVVYGEANLKRNHPVVEFLANDKHAKSINVYPDGLDVFEQIYPFLVTPSTKANATRRYPGEIVPKLLYLGDWAHALDYESLRHLQIARILTIHNNPENLKPPGRYKHKQFVLADVETEDVSKFFDESYTFIEESRAAKEGVLVHCGAGVSRSSAICIAYLMRKFNWSAAKAKAHCVQRRSVVQPNDGFWRSLCAFEGRLGIQDRSDPAAMAGFSGADAPAKLSENAAGEKVTVAFISMAKVREIEAAEEAAAAALKNPKLEGLSSEVKGSGGSKRKERIEDSEKSHKRSRHISGNSLTDDRASQDRSETARNDNARRHSERDKDEDRRRGRQRRQSWECDDRNEHRHRTSEKHDRSERHTQRQDLNPDRYKEKTPQSAKDTIGTDTGVKKAAPVVLESAKDGKAIGRLELGLHSPLQRCVFGRLPSNEVVLEHLSISRQHAQLSLDSNGELFITDLGSAHQTNVNGVWIRPHQARPIPVGSVFKLGGSTREFKVIMTPKELTRIQKKTKQIEDLEEAKRNSGYINGNGQ